MNIFEEAQAVRGYKVMSIQAMGMFADKHTSDKGKMKKSVRDAIRTAWECDPLPYARAYRMAKDLFTRDGDSVSEWDLLKWVLVGKVKSKFARPLLAEQCRNQPMDYNDVLAAVESMNKPKPREKKVKHCAVCGAEQP
jgi:hypothetical protein